MAPSLDSDPITNVIHNGIKKDIRLLLEGGGYSRGAILLIYAGMDAMAYLGMPAEQDDVTRQDFVGWVEDHVRFPCQEQLSGKELYGARCAALHMYGTESRLSRKEGVRQVGYMDASVPEIRSTPMHPHFVLVSIPALAEAFFQAIDRFLVALFADPQKRPVAERRFQKIMHQIPVKDL
jgi:hypothetical protein